MSKPNLKSLKSPASSDHVRFSDKVEYSEDPISPKKKIENDSPPMKRVERELKSSKFVDSAAIKADTRPASDKRIKSSQSVSSIQFDSNSPLLKDNFKTDNKDKSPKKSTESVKSESKKSKDKDLEESSGSEKKTKSASDSKVENPPVSSSSPKKSSMKSKSAVKDSDDEKNKLQIEVPPPSPSVKVDPRASKQQSKPASKPKKNDRHGNDHDEDAYEKKYQGNNEEEDDEEDEGSVEEKPMTEEELKEHMYSLFTHIYAVLDGAVMKIKDGAAGNIPANDNFPLFKASKQRRVSINWKHPDPMQWAIILHNIPTDGKAPQLRRVISIAEVSEVFIKDPASKSFRVYCESEVSQFTPVESHGVKNIPAVAWADAIYSIADLQVLDRDDILRFKALFDEDHGIGGSGVAAAASSMMMDGGEESLLHATASGDESMDQSRGSAGEDHDDRDADPAEGEGSSAQRRRGDSEATRDSTHSQSSQQQSHHDSEGDHEESGSGVGSPSGKKRGGLLRRVTSLFTGSGGSARGRRSTLSHAHSTSDVLGSPAHQNSPPLSPPLRKPSLLQRISSMGSAKGEHTSFGVSNDLLNGTNNTQGSPSQTTPRASFHAATAAAAATPDSPKSAALSSGFLSMSLMSGAGAGSGSDLTGLGSGGNGSASNSPKRPLSIIREGTEAEEHESSAKVSPSAATAIASVGLDLSEGLKSNSVPTAVAPPSIEQQYLLQQQQLLHSNSAGAASGSAVTSNGGEDKSKLFHLADRDALASHITKKRLSLLVLPLDSSSAAATTTSSAAAPAAVSASSVSVPAAVNPTAEQSATVGASAGEIIATDAATAAAASVSPTRRKHGTQSMIPPAPAPTLLGRRSVLDTILQQQRAGASSPEERAQHLRDDYYNEYPSASASPLRSPSTGNSYWEQEQQQQALFQDQQYHSYGSSTTSLGERNAAMSRIFSLQNPPMQVISLQASTSSDIRLIPGGSVSYLDNHHRSGSDGLDLESSPRSGSSPLKPRVTFSPFKKGSAHSRSSAASAAGASAGSKAAPRSWLKTPTKVPSESGGESISGSATSAATASSVREQRLFQMLSGIKDAFSPKPITTPGNDSHTASASVGGSARGRLTRAAAASHSSSHVIESATSESDHEHSHPTSGSAAGVSGLKSLQELQQQGAERQSQYRRWQQKQKQFLEANRSRVYSSDSDYAPTTVATSGGGVSSSSGGPNADAASTLDVSHLQLSSSKPPATAGSAGPLEVPNVSFDLGTPIKPIAFNDLLLEAAARQEAIAASVSAAAAAAAPSGAKETTPSPVPHKHRHGAYPTVFQHTEHLVKDGGGTANDSAGGGSVDLQLSLDILAESRKAIQSSQELISNSPTRQSGSNSRSGSSVATSPVPSRPTTVETLQQQQQRSPLNVTPSAPPARRNKDSASASSPAGGAGVVPFGGVKLADVTISDSRVAKINIAPVREEVTPVKKQQQQQQQHPVANAPTPAKSTNTAAAAAAVSPAVTGSAAPGKAAAAKQASPAPPQDNQNTRPRVNAASIGASATSASTAANSSAAPTAAVSSKARTSSPLKTAAANAAAAAAAAAASGSTHNSPPPPQPAAAAAAMGTSTAAFVPSEGRHLLHAQFQKKSVVCGIVPQSVLLINGHLSVQHTVMEEYPSSSAAGGTATAPPKPVFYLSITEISSNDTLLVPLRDIVSADIDANGTGLFRLCITRYFDHSYYYPQIHNNRVLSPLKKSLNSQEQPQQQQHPSIFTKVLNGSNDADPTAPINLILKTNTPDRPKEWLELLFRYKRKGKA